MLTFSTELRLVFLVLMFSIELRIPVPYADVFSLQLSFLFLVLMFSSGLLLTFTYNQFPKLQVAEVKLSSSILSTPMQ